MNTSAAFLILPIALMALPGQLRAESSVSCERELLPGDMHEFRCPVPAISSARRARFIVFLSGGHDDSSSALAVWHGGKELLCGEGSKTVSEREDGDIVLECLFTLPAATPAMPSTLAAAVKASHTNFERYSFKLD